MKQLDEDISSAIKRLKVVSNDDGKVTLSTETINNPDALLHRILENEKVRIKYEQTLLIFLKVIEVNSVSITSINRYAKELTDFLKVLE